MENLNIEIKKLTHENLILNQRIQSLSNLLKEEKKSQHSQNLSSNSTRFQESQEKSNNQNFSENKSYQELDKKRLKLLKEHLNLVLFENISNKKPDHELTEFKKYFSKIQELKNQILSFSCKCGTQKTLESKNPLNNSEFSSKILADSEFDIKFKSENDRKVKDLTYNDFELNQQKIRDEEILEKLKFYENFGQRILRLVSSLADKRLSESFQETIHELNDCYCKIESVYDEINKLSNDLKANEKRYREESEKYLIQVNDEKNRFSQEFNREKDEIYKIIEEKEEIIRDLNQKHLKDKENLEIEHKKNLDILNESLNAFPEKEEILKELERLKDHASELVKENNILNEKINEITSNDFKQQAKDYATIENLKSHLQNLENEKLSLELNLKQQKEIFNQSELSQTKNQNLIKDLSTEINLLNQQLEEKSKSEEKNIKTLKAELDSYLKQSAENNENLKKLQNEQEKLIKKNKNLKEINKNLLKEKESISKILDEIKNSESSKNEFQVSEMKIQVENYQREIEIYRNNNTILSKTLANKDDDLNSVKNNLRELENNLVTERLLFEQENKTLRMNLEMNPFENEILLLKKNFEIENGLRVRINELEVENKKLKTENEIQVDGQPYLEVLKKITEENFRLKSKIFLMMDSR